MSLARDIADLGSSATALDKVGSNLLMNGAQVISQRGTSAITASSSADTFITDRFRISNYSDATFTGQQVADAPTDFEYSCKVTTTGTDTSLAAGQYQRFITAIEGYNMNHLMYGTSSAKTCTLTFHVKSSLTGAFYVFGFNASANRSIVVGYTIDSANTWEKKTLTIAGDTSGSWNTTNGAGMYFGWLLGSGTTRHTTTTDVFQSGFVMGKSDQVNLAGTNSATWQITGVQLEVGSATDFEHRSFGDELARCQRYTYVVKGDDDDHTGFIGYTESAANARFGVLHPVPMRAAPSFTFSGTCRAQGGTNDSANFTSGLAIANPNTSNTGACVRVTGTSGMGAADRGYNLQFKANGSSFIFDAEL